jgi:hypothetical protein
MGGKIPHDWRIEMWSVGGAIERCLATCDRLDIAIAAYEQAIATFPEKNVTLRQGSRVIREHRAQA